MSVVVINRAGAKSEHSVAAGTTAAELFADDKAVVAAKVNGVERDLSQVVSDGDEIEPIAIDSPAGRAILRHSTAHVLAQAVQDLYPEAKLGIGPPIESGLPVTTAGTVWPACIE